MLFLVGGRLAAFRNTMLLVCPVIVGGGLFLHLMLRNCLGWGGGMITFLQLVHTFDAAQLFGVGWVGG